LLESPNKRFAHIVARAWSDPKFKKRLLSDPKAVLAEYKLDLPPGVTEVLIVENTEDTVYFILPAKPGSVDHLSLTNVPIEILDSPCHGHEVPPLCTLCGDACDKGSSGDDQD
jgi:hypothetical protein